MDGAVYPGSAWDGPCHALIDRAEEMAERTRDPWELDATVRLPVSEEPMTEQHHTIHTQPFLEHH